ncbi:malto-oligosyltrehalose trehalohydrolase [Rhizobium sp. NPDC090275]|uniref:malto-oligosyltrehalose trehalohydrolase n=1 Tax=Rhizobium sp. NPDC090275 TaxID=3364498 RepID=UPI00383A81BC
MTQLSFGPLFEHENITFRFWAPKHKSIMLRLAGISDLAMEAHDNGWFTRRVDGVAPGSRYSFVLSNGLVVPDPASRYQPDDVHGASELVGGKEFPWSRPQWKGRPWNEMVIYELHVGTFTEAGTFTAAIERLDYLRQLGVTALQLMPVADFRGGRGWGYDGVLPYAPESSYGRPEDLKALIDAAHEREICCFLDVVYNHFGPDGNYIPAYAPLFSDKHSSPWGDGVNYDDEGSSEVRKFVVENVAYWINEFRFDGLRFDAVHAIKDDSDQHLLALIASTAKEAAGDRHVHLIVENEDNASDLLERDANGIPKLYTAQWNDDIHHVLHSAATGEDFGYYADYAHDPDKIARALSEGFVFQGEQMPYRGSRRGQPSRHLPPTAFISFIQNHDQVGNRAFGDRLSNVASLQAIKALAGAYLLAPQIPMIFQGEEWNARTPFPYFCDFDEELNENVRKGRREELSRLPGFDDESAKLAPDPTTLGTFLSAKLNWQEPAQADNAAMLDTYRELIALRHREIVPHLDACHTEYARTSGHIVEVCWSLGIDRRLLLVANLSSEVQRQQGVPAGRSIWSTGSIDTRAIGAWSVVWTID